MKRLIISFAVITFFFSTLQAQVDRTKPPLPGPPPKIEIGSYQKQVMANGLTVILVENHKIPSVSYNLFIDIDPIMQGDQEGYVDFAGSLLGTGTQTRTKDQINDEIDFIGANMNFFARGFSASCLKKHNEKLLEIVSDALINPNFTQEELEKIRKQTLSGLAAEKTSPDAISDRINSLVVFGKDHPYGHRESEASVNAITLDQCKNYYTTYMRPNKAYLAIVGDITMQEAIPLIEKYFSKWEKKDVPTYQYPTPMAPPTNTIALVDRSNSVQSVIKVSYPVPFKIGDKDYIRGRIMNTILGGGTFRLYNNLREKHGYTYGSYSSLNPDKYIGSFTANAEVRNSVTDSSLVQIMAEMNRLMNEPVPQAELDMVKNYVSGTFALSLEKPETVATFAQNIERFGLPKDYYEKYLTNIAALTPEDIQQAAREYLKPGNCYIVVVGKAEEISKKLEVLTPGTRIRYFDVEGKEYDPTQVLKPIPAGMTAQMVNEKYIEAVGGRKNLEKVKDLTINMTTTMQGMTLTFKSYRKAPNKFLLEIGMGGMVVSKQLYDGNKAAVTSPQGNEEPSGEELELMKNEALFNPELDYAKNGITITLLGIEDIKGVPAYKMEIKFPSGQKNYAYYDIKTGLKIRELNEQGPTDLSDYREVKGIKYPFVLEAEIQGQALKMQVQSIEVNTKIKDDIFKI
ncbi:MAG: pitrilysin family protein [Bacteroidetes bacterium]|nr:pitrilysin family protein [Bacteroidota bacterium]